MNRFLKLVIASGIAAAASSSIAQTPVQLESVAGQTVPKPATAATAIPGSTGDAHASTHVLNAADLATFFDGLVPFALQRGDVAGGVISVVKDGKLIFAKGYGYADLKTRQVPSPETTLFRPGSTSKLFTWTAVMQQVELGKLDLDRDVNDYLDFKIPSRDGKPITLRNIMTHTPGFEDTARGLLPATAAEVNLGKYLKSHIPARIFPPGEIVAYSNYGAGLAGYMVQRVSGESFEDYVQNHILEPLAMHHSTFAQPLPASLAGLMAKGYNSVSNGKPEPFEFVNPAPAGALTSSANDMANFMIAQLQDGRFGDTRILQAKTAELMHSPQHTAAPGLNGFDLGFYQENSNGQRIIGHAGDTIVFHSDLHLLLDAHVGLFMSLNSAGNEGGAQVIRTAIFQAFLDRYFPYSTPSPPTVSTAQADAARVAGWYESSRRNNALRALYLLGETSVTAQPDGTIAVSALTDYAGIPYHWRETGPLSYTEVHGRARLKFVTDARGTIRYWATDAEAPVFVFQRVLGYKALGTIELLVPLSTLVALATLLTWFVGWRVRRHYRRALELPRDRRRIRLLSRLGVLALVTVVLGWLALMVAISANELLLLRGSATPWIVLLYILGVVGLLGAIAVVIHAVRAWMAPRCGRWVLAGETLLALSATYLAWFIVAFGLVSFNLRF